MNEEISPLYASTDADPDHLWLAPDLIRWPMARYCDPDMPRDAREAIAAEIESRTTEPDFQLKSECRCQVCGATLTVELRMIDGDDLANHKPLVFPAEALAHYVREHGLRIDPRLLISRFAIRPSGSREPFTDTQAG